MVDVGCTDLNRLGASAAMVIGGALSVLHCSCASMTEEVVGVVIREVVQELTPVAHMTAAAVSYQVENNRFPSSPEELAEFTSSVTNVPHFDPEEFKVLTFENSKTNSMVIYYELDILSGHSTGTLTINAPSTTVRTE